MISPFYQCLLYFSVSSAPHTNVLILHLYSYLLRPRFRCLGLKDENFDIYKWQAEKGVTFLFLTALKSWEKQSASDLCMCPGHGDKSAIPKCLSEIGLGLALNTMSSSFRKLAGGQMYSCPVSWEASIMQRCSYKCHSLNGNAAGHVCTPWGLLSQRKSTVEVGKHPPPQLKTLAP